jgi:hypothetical protein
MPVELNTVYRNAAAGLDVQVVENPAYRFGTTQARNFVEWSPTGQDKWQCVGYATAFEQAAAMVQQYRHQRYRPGLPGPVVDR